MNKKPKKYLWRLFRVNAAADLSNLGEHWMTDAEANHFNEIMKDQSARWYKVD